MATMAANAASNNASSMHYTSELVNMAESSMELTKRFAQMQLKTANCALKRQPTIVCEDIADDDELVDEDSAKGEQTGRDENSLLRSASSVSLTVPVQCEDELTEKRRPPLPDN